MTTDVKTLREKIEEQAFRWRVAVSNWTMVPQETERLKNVMINNLDEIIEALKMAEKAESRIAEIQESLDFAEAELKDQDDEIKKLRNTAAPKPAAKGRMKAKAEPVDVTDLPDGKVNVE